MIQPTNRAEMLAYEPKFKCNDANLSCDEFYVHWMRECNPNGEIDFEAEAAQEEEHEWMRSAWLYT